MGIVASYCAHFYCDSCNDFMEVGEYQTYSETIKNVKAAWLLRSDGVVLCEKCQKIENPVLIDEAKREGINWNWRKQLKAQEQSHD
ncbi:hypothetical protein [Acinetobacter bereziniae]|uniref:hypothetical protein n=1 Tax=Acinetobacter bereziniae TaxID=106648 RepID=UPI0019004C86|nr:hypothetical protein [Acinetobacter bereziniae]MBJ9901971.1 hypothetical protein [Acinetobacter bereziniae]